MKFIHWNKLTPVFDYDPADPYFSILVPTVDTTRYQTILDYLISIRKPTFFTGETGTGKSVIIMKYLSIFKDKKQLQPVMLNFSAQTSSPSIQQNIESKLEKKKGKKYLGAMGNNKVLLFVDDVNMPSVETYGAQPPIELLRQLLDQGGFYDRPKFFWKFIEKYILVCSAAPPLGGRSPLTPRFMRFFHILCVPNPSEDRLRTIFEGIIMGFLNKGGFPDIVKKSGALAV
jgi:dynein heavy chain